MKSLATFLCLAVLGVSAFAQTPGFKLDGEKWAYTAGDRSFAGYLIKPAGNGPFPAVVINHGKGGRPDQFSVNWAREMVQWGLVGICPTLTHVAGTDIQGQDGASDENIAPSAAWYPDANAQPSRSAYSPLAAARSTGRGNSSRTGRVNCHQLSSDWGAGGTGAVHSQWSSALKAR